MEELIPILKRIADAFEEQNRQSAEWIALQTLWHSESDPHAARIVAIHEENAERDSLWRQVQAELIEQYMKECRQMIEQSLKKEEDEDE